MFERSKDWVDIEAIAKDGRSDLDRARRWPTDLLGVDAPQVARLDAITSERRLASERGAEPDRPRPQGPGRGFGL